MFIFRLAAKDKKNLELQYKPKGTNVAGDAMPSKYFLVASGEPSSLSELSGPPAGRRCASVRVGIPDSRPQKGGGRKKERFGQSKAEGNRSVSRAGGHARSSSGAGGRSAKSRSLV